MAPMQRVAFSAPPFIQSCGQNERMLREAVMAITFGAKRRKLNDISLWGLHSNQISLITSYICDIPIRCWYRRRLT